ncbi:hypothetical protein ADL02_38530 [Streptomyces sp. NRRL WC-3723]|nr:hypothetical protein ADL02_38530 [Streptomyces sp. NRRL WC-3723]
MVEISWGQANFHTGTNLTGTLYPVPATDTACTNLPEPMLSVANFKYANVEISKGKDCTYDLGNVTGLHRWNPAIRLQEGMVFQAAPVAISSRAPAAMGKETGLRFSPSVLPGNCALTCGSPVAASLITAPP